MATRVAIALRAITVFTSVGLVVFAASPARSDVIISTFDSGVEGWISVGNGSGSAVYSATVGNPGGAIQMTDVINGFGYFQAPAPFIVPNLYGQSFSMDLSTVASGPDPIAFVVQVAVTGSGGTLIAGRTLPTSSLVNYNFTFVESDGWRLYSSRDNSYTPTGGAAPTLAQFQAIVNNPGSIYVSADHTNGTVATGTTETTTLDNVRLVTAGPTEDADFDADGDVDGADFMTWQRGVGTTTGGLRGNGNANPSVDGDVDGDDLAVWRNQFGAGASAAASVVPEARSIALWLFAGTCFVCRVNHESRLTRR